MEKDTDSTVTSLDENTENFCDNPTRDILAEGIIGLFKPAVDRLDERIRTTRTVQSELRLQLDILSQQLKDIEKAQELIPDYSDKVKKLVTVKNKVTVVANILQTCQERLNELHKQIEKEQAKRKALLETGTL